MAENRLESPLQLDVHTLPSDVVAQIRKVQSEDPDLLRNILLYGMTHRAVFETLSRSWAADGWLKQLTAEQDAW